MSDAVPRAFAIGAVSRALTAAPQARAWFWAQGRRFRTQRLMSTALLIRLAGAGIAFFSQPLLARWMGAEEFGIYAYVWTWVLLFGSLIDFGFAANAQRFIPEYTRNKAQDLLRGFLSGSRWLVVALSTAIALLGALAVHLATPMLGAVLILPLYLACMTLPLYGLIMVQDGIARSYDWMNVALLPLYIIRPLAILGLMLAAHLLGFAATAKSAMLASVVATWATALLQMAVLNRRLTERVPRGARQHDWRRWINTSLPIFLVGSFFFLLTYTDVLVLQHFRPAEQVAIYFAATKVVSLIAFIYFSVSATVAHKFSAYHIAGDREGLRDFVTSSVRWTFWPSVLVTVGVLALGQPILWLFGPEFTAGYPLLFVLAVGLLARASVGPTERLLTMLGEQKLCALLYACAFAVNVTACLLLVPALGATGAAIATSIALVFESVGLFLAARQRLGLSCFVAVRA